MDKLEENEHLMDEIVVIGGGLAGSEAALQIASKNIKVKLYEMKPIRYSAAHTNENLGEIVCSNSFKSNLITNACGLLKEELRGLGSFLIPIADSVAVPSGQALAVDRERFSEEVTRKIVESNYFLVGGFDNDLREGKILLYKINYGERAYNTTIEFKQEIIFKDRDDIDAFNGPINCLRQSKKTGNIAASCFDGNIYLLTPPNINYYIEEDNNIAITG